MVPRGHNMLAAAEKFSGCASGRVSDVERRSKGSRKSSDTFVISLYKVVLFLLTVLWDLLSVLNTDDSGRKLSNEQWTKGGAVGLTAAEEHKGFEVEDGIMDKIEAVDTTTATVAIPVDINVAGTTGSTVNAAESAMGITTSDRKQTDPSHYGGSDRA
eukprot:Clim_evm41s143 gene=Clim_evmTU41s143